MEEILYLAVIFSANSGIIRSVQPVFESDTVISNPAGTTKQEFYPHEGSTVWEDAVAHFTAMGSDTAKIEATREEYAAPAITISRKAKQ